MDRLRIGFRVCDIQGRALGSVTALNKCCFVYKPSNARPPLRLTPDALFTVEDERVTVVTEEAGLSRYLCFREEHDDVVLDAAI